MNRGQTPAIRTQSRTVANVALALASCLAGLALVEAALRFFHPKYEHLAAALFIRDPILGYARQPNSRGAVLHPDTGERHPFHHNNFGSRQHRNFSAADLDASVNIGFFGDSFTENARMDAPFSFTEPLDHLLNVNAGRTWSRGGDGAPGAEGEAARGFNVLNFGVGGYSTQQSLLRYETSALRGTLDHVFYVYFRNDLWENQAFQLDDAGRPEWVERAHNPWAPLGKLHLSYLALDAARRLSIDVEATGLETGHLFEDGWWMRPDRGAPAALAKAARQGAPDPYALFRQLLRRFKAAAEGDGASFQLVRLPDIPCGVACRSARGAGFELVQPPDTPDGFSVAAIVAEEGVEAVNLQRCFAELDPAHPHTSWWQSPYRFRGDGHWNEAGNRLAVVCLHRFLAGRLGLPPLSADDVAQVLDRYYAAFEASAPADPAAAAIRARYNALRGDAPADQRRLPAPWTPSPDKLVIRSHFDVYLHDGWLAYVREGCQPNDARAPFFLHVVPRDVRDLSARRLPAGFDNLDFDWHAADWLDDSPIWVDSAHSDGRSEAAGCTAYRRLPDYAIERIRTGQFAQLEGGTLKHLWEGEHVLPLGLPTSARGNIATSARRTSSPR